MANVLIIDDDRPLCEIISAKLTKLDHSITCAHTLHSATRNVQNNVFDIVLLDVGLPDGNGLEVLHQFQEMPSAPEVIIITGQAEVSGARLAIETGAWDYVEKGASLDDIVLPIVRALQYRQEKGIKTKPVALKRKGIIGDSPALTACLDQVAEVSGYDTPVLITGESGTGKELFAWAIHENSKWAQGTFVVVDCAALPETLTESILFGHEAGAYTGADRAKDGLIREAHGGTLFLDEIGELSLKAQRAFLRVLQEKRFRRIGGAAEVSSDFRAIAATNRDLEQMVKDGRFRADLLFRLNQISLKLPPLKDRGPDLPSLVFYRLKKLAHIQGVESKGVSPEFLASLTAYHWPGNIRELFGVLEQSVMTAGKSPTLFAVHLPNRIRLSATVGSLSDHARTVTEAKSQPGDPAESTPDLKKARSKKIAEFEKDYLQQLLNQTDGDIPAVCRLAKISRSQFYNLMKKHSISR